MRWFYFVLLLTQCGCALLGPLNPMKSVEQKLIYHPTKSTQVPFYQDVESVMIDNGQEDQLHGLLLQHHQAKAVLLYCHGNAGNIVDRLPRLRQLRDRHQISILGFDYRGYGLSAGQPSEKNVYADARAARAWLSKRFAIPERQVVLMGRSFGGAVAVELATDGARGLILESTFSSISDVGQSMAKVIPVSLLVSQRFDSYAKIQQYKGPLLQAHGTADQIVPFKIGEKLHRHANQPKQFLALSGGHNDATHPDYPETLNNFIMALQSPHREQQPERVSQ